MSVKSSIWPKRLGDSRNGDRNFEAICPDNSIMTGAVIRSGSKVDKITSIQCAHPSRIYTTNRENVMPTDWSGGNGGNETTLYCPTGSAIYKIQSGWDKGDTIGYLTLTCADVKTGRETASKKFGNVTGDTGNTVVSKSNHYIGGFQDGNSGTLVDSTNVIMKDMTGLKDVYTSDEGLLKACAGQYKDFCPLSKADCDIHSLKFCQANPGHVLCTCINSDVIKRARDEDYRFPDCPNIYDSKCAATGYKLAVYDKALNEGKCSYQNCQIKASDSLIYDSDVSIVQTCTFKDGTTETNKTVLPTEAKPKDFEGEDKEEESGFFLWAIGLFLLIISLIAGFFFIKSKNADNTDVDTDDTTEYAGGRRFKK